MITARELKRILLHTSGDRWRFLVHGYLKVPPGLAQTNALSPDQQLILGVFDWMSHLGCVSDSSQERIVTWLRDDLTEFSTAIVGGDDGSVAKLPIAMLTISDCRFVTFTNRQGWFDTQIDATIEELPSPAVTHIICDLTALHTRMNARLQQIQGGSHDRQPDPESKLNDNDGATQHSADCTSHVVE